MNELATAVQAARSAGAILREEYQKNHKGQRKSDNTLVSEADLIAEKAILGIIQQTFPEHSIFSEESGFASPKPGEGGHATSEYLWIVDPLDGSTNFLERLHHFAVAIALVKSGEPRLGVIYHPLTDELFCAEAGQGATLNGEPLQPSTETDLARALVHFARGHVNTERHAKIYQAVTTRTHSLRLIGSASLGSAYTSAGRFSAHVASDCKIYDAIAGSVIAKSAGLKVTDFAGNDWQPDVSDPASASDIIISGPNIHDQLIAALR